MIGALLGMIGKLAGGGGEEEGGGGGGIPDFSYMSEQMKQNAPIAANLLMQPRPPAALGQPQIAAQPGAAQLPPALSSLPPGFGSLGLSPTGPPTSLKDLGISGEPRPNSLEEFQPKTLKEFMGNPMFKPLVSQVGNNPADPSGMPGEQEQPLPPISPEETSIQKNIVQGALDIVQGMPKILHPMLNLPSTPEGLYAMEDRQRRMGDIASKYESGGDWGAVSSGAGDPGGASYGRYQLASKTGTLQAFLKQSQYDREFKGLSPGTQAFNTKWKQLAGMTEFRQSQQDFIRKRHFEPVRAIANSVGLPQSRMVNEALWSMGVQHGKAGQIVRNAFKGVDPRKMGNEAIVQRLYQHRSNYVSNLRTLSPKIKRNIINRYKNEMSDVLSLKD
jgi:hypothetical protein